LNTAAFVRLPEKLLLLWREKIYFLGKAESHDPRLGSVDPLDSTGVLD
jgi:hypothetical protein